MYLLHGYIHIGTREYYTNLLPVDLTKTIKYIIY